MASDAIVPARTSAAPSPIESLTNLAATGKLGPEALEKLLSLHERIVDRDARMAFVQAMAAFQAEVPTIRKSRTAKIATKGGGAYSYSYAPLEEIVRTIRPLLARHGLSYTWDSTADQHGVAATCTVRHIDGHHETATFTAPVETAAAMSGAQKHAAALTFARRQSLVQALGLTTADEDDDGASAGGGTPVETITAAQAADLHALATEVGVDERKFLAWLGGYSLYTEIPADEYGRAVEALERKRGGA